MRTAFHLLAIVSLTGALVSLAEWADPEVGRFRRREALQDLGWLLLYVAYVPFVAIGSFALAKAVRRHSPLGAALGDAMWARVVIAVVVAEAAYYWLHRLFHATRVGWWVHRVHHSSTDLHWWSAFRFHPVEVVVVTVVPAAVGAWFGAGSAAAVYSFAATIVTTFAHADVYVPGRVLDRVVCTPGYHRTHHETGRERCNYALVLPLADIAFGTADFRRGEPRHFGSLTTATPPPSATHCWPLPQQ
ncbi:MAG TPA: sterol desaturase family protein [Ilumatobacteraceae bacterium]|nr:sterol desaturase family protein [Ilumatobacteraceae bacterium]